MKSLFRAITINLKILYRDKFFAIAMILFPILLGLIYSTATQSYSANVLRTAFVDLDQTHASSEILQRLEKHSELHLVKASMTKAENMLESGKVEAAFVVNKGFQSHIDKGDPSSSFKILTLPSSFSGEYLSEILSSEVSVLSLKKLTASLISDRYRQLGLSDQGLREKSEKYYESFTENKPLLKINFELLNTSRKKEEPSEAVINPHSNTSAGGLLVFIMFFLMFGSGWMIESRENGTFKRIKSVYKGFTLSFWGTFTGLVIAGLLQTSVFSVIYAAFGKSVITNIPAFAVLFAFILSISSLSMFLAAIFKTTSQLQAFTPIFILMTSFAGSCFWDISLLSKRFEALSLFTPQGLAIKALNAVNRGLNSPDWIVYSAVLLSASVIFILPGYFIASRSE